MKFKQFFRQETNGMTYTLAFWSNKCNVTALKYIIISVIFYDMLNPGEFGNGLKLLTTYKEG